MFDLLNDVYDSWQIHDRLPYLHIITSTKQITFFQYKSDYFTIKEFYFVTVLQCLLIEILGTKR